MLENGEKYCQFFWKGIGNKPFYKQRNKTVGQGQWQANRGFSKRFLRVYSGSPFLKFSSRQSEGGSYFL
jgi:hypothetical protein